jgi:hypothetical protein
VKVTGVTACRAVCAARRGALLHTRKALFPLRIHLGKLLCKLLRKLLFVVGAILRALLRKPLLQSRIHFRKPLLPPFGVTDILQ